MNGCKKKIIPWHAQQRYMESLSQLSLNQTISTAIYKKKIRSLQRNNKHLALALQRNRGLVTEKENLLIDNGKILDIINFSRIKLMNMAINMKQATECLDETLLLLNSSLNDSLSKHSPLNQNYRNSFKNKLQEISKKSSIEEVSENSSSSSKKVAPCAQKGKISRVDGCVSSPNKKRKVAMKERAIKINCKDHEKSTKEFSSAVPTTCSKKTFLKTSRKCSSTLNTKPPNRKKSLTKNSKNEFASLSKLPNSSSNLFLQTKTNDNSLNNKQKAVKVMLTDIAEGFLAQGTKNHHSPIKNVYVSSSSNKCLIQNSPEDDILIQKFFSSGFTSKEKSSASNSCDSKFASILNADYSQNTSSLSTLSHGNLFCSDVTENHEKPLLSSEKNEYFVLNQPSSVVKIEESDTIAKQDKGNFLEKIDSETDKKSYKFHNSKVTNRVHFYFDEDAIEKVEGNTITSKDKIRKSFNKCKARKTVSHKKKNITSESAASKSNLILPDSISKLGKNSFLVTAEVHSPPNGINKQKLSKIYDSRKMEPRVVLTDIFKSNQSLLYEMVGGKLQENRCLQRSITKSAIAPMAEINSYAVNKNYACNGNSINSASVDAENDTEK